MSWSGRTRQVIAGCLVAMLGAACTQAASGASGRIDVVGAFYPLAWVAQEVGGPRVNVVDLTPPGVEAHDTNLSARQVADVENADVVLILGYLGFQPQVEQAARQASGRVVEVTRQITLRPSQERGLSADPHVWLDPALMENIVQVVARALVIADPGGTADYQARGDRVVRQLASLDQRYRAGLQGCRFSQFVTTHEAFGYLADQYGLQQIGIEGLTPEAEPSAQQLRTTEDAIRSGKAAPAVFYEETAEGERIGKTVAGAVGAPALPLGTLEFDPAPGNYMSVMQANLASLRKGLQCP
ncbi:MAG: zinc ABC transporter substrate-binding protein [Actinobacteria bacterium]|nr:MAG: zinc ABC transporter substrate-binding protein [Actinomycetota bacterium]